MTDRLTTSLMFTESRQTQYTPGYTGEVPLVSGELGSPDKQLIKKTDIRRDLPPATAVSRFVVVLVFGDKFEVEDSDWAMGKVCLN